MSIKGIFKSVKRGNTMTIKLSSARKMTNRDMTFLLSEISRIVQMAEWERWYGENGIGYLKENKL